MKLFPTFFFFSVRNFMSVTPFSIELPSDYCIAIHKGYLNISVFHNYLTKPRIIVWCLLCLSVAITED